jgi:hypothetical protein
MAGIHIARNHESLGIFSEEEIQEGIRTGRFASGDLAWRSGMAEWKPLGEMALQWGMETPPATAGVTPPDLPGEAPTEGTEPPWEDRETLGFFPALTQTISAVLLRPRVTFARMKRDGGLANPLLYFVLLSSAMFTVSALYQMGASMMNPALFAPQLLHAPKSALFVGIIGSILLSPALYVVSAFLSSGIIHLCLKMLGGANSPFEATFRVFCYAQASASVMNLLPVCGGIAGIIWGAYCIIIGLKEAHGISGWKATIAITLPGLFCCGVIGIVVMAAGIGIAEAAKLVH